MTAPGAQPFHDKPPINIAGDVLAGPAGPIGVLNIQTGPISFTIMLTDNEAGQMATVLPGILTELAAQIRRAKLGLVVPRNGATPVPPNLRGDNGRP